MSIETADDLDSFFDTNDFATRCVVTGPNAFTKTIIAIFDHDGEAIDAYGDTDIDVNDPSMLAKTVELADVVKGHTVTFPDLEPHEDGYGKTYEVKRLFPSKQNTRLVTLKES